MTIRTMQYLKPAVTAKGALFFLLLWLLPIFVFGGNIRIGMFYGREVKAITFSVVEGEYIIYGDYRQVGTARKGFIYHIGNSGGSVTIQDTAMVYGTFLHIEFKGISHDNVFAVKPVDPSLTSKETDDDLMIEGDEDLLRVVNIIDLDKYIAGTIEAEGGPNADTEFYKAQAILARTFAIKNYYRHGTEGYNLCDSEHCQAYKGKSRMNKAIPLAAMATKDLVMFNRYGSLINAPYHSNCGGVTAEASMVWDRSLPYLQSVTDPFCRHSGNASWELSMDRGKWVDYLSGKGFTGYMLSNPDFRTDKREKYYLLGGKQLALNDIRKDLKLKSAWFSITCESDKVIFHGRGYGHGVGLCQEGAMKMAEKGYVYVDILHFYFRDITIAAISETKTK
jgi:stage II sporulation protein D